MNDFKKLLFFLVFSLVFTGISYAEQKSGITTVPEVAEIKASSTGHEAMPEFAMDDNLETRWGSEPGVDPVWLRITLKNKMIISSVKIIWERASAKRYKIQVSEDAEQWRDVGYIKDGKEGERRIITFEPVETKYIRIYAEERATQWGYSIWELILNPEETSLPAFNPDHPYNNPKLPFEKRVEDLLSRMSLREKASLLSGEGFMETRGNKRLHIPPMIMTDGPHGVGAGSTSTSFPTGVSMAATWDESLIYKVGVALGRETKAQGRHILLGPCVNIHRTPLGGRNFESFSEDPYLASRITVAYINGVQSQKIGASVKHYACNNQEWERGTISSEIEERALREIYLPAFKAAVQEANTLSAMGAYNRINGIYACENKHLLTDILKTEWGFNGFVVSDWGAVHSTAESLNAGCDLEMPGPGNFFIEEKVLQSVKRGDVSKDIIDDKVRRILRVMFWLGLFDDPNPRSKGALDTPEHREIARKVAENAIVLLKNKNNILPLDSAKIKSTAVIGPNASVARLGGGGSSTVSPSYWKFNRCSFKISYPAGWFRRNSWS
jgi:beta-glucosidase-like glycosyl hydrolase